MTSSLKFFLNSLLHKTNRFQVAVRLFSNRSQRTSKCGKNINDTYGCASCATFLFLPHFDVICDLLLKRRTGNWNLFVNYIISSVMHAFWLVFTNDLLEDRRIDDVIIKTFLNSLLYNTNRFQVAVHLFSNRSQRTSKCGKNISDTLGCTSHATFLFLPHFDIICDLLQNSDTLSCTSCATFLFLPHFDIICDLLHNSDTLGCTSCATFLFLPHFDVIYDLFLNRCSATWNLFVKFAILYLKLSISRSSEIF